MKLAITGHRPHALGGYEWNDPKNIDIRTAMLDMFKKLKPNLIITGMALGVDQYAAYLAECREIPFDAYIPCKDQDRLWRDIDKRRYQHFLNKARQVIYISNEPYDKTKTQMKDRNKRMIEDGDTVLAVWNGKRNGGTYHAVSYARRINRPLYIIDPNNLHEEYR